MPTAIQWIPENVAKIIRKFADDIVQSLQFALKKVPDNLSYVKLKCKCYAVSGFMCHINQLNYFSGEAII